MNNEELKVKEALEYFGFGVREVSSKELKYTYLSFENRLNPNTCDNEIYKDGIEYNKMLAYYEEIKDVRRTNEIVHNILNPEHKEHFYTEGEKVEVINPEIIDNNEEQPIPEGVRVRLGDIRIVDRPSLMTSLISILVPIYGFIASVMIRPIKPKASRWYLVFGLIGFIVNLVLMYFLYRI